MFSETLSHTPCTIHHVPADEMTRKKPHTEVPPCIPAVTITSLVDLSAKDIMQQLRMRERYEDRLEALKEMHTIHTVC
ncbi:hypothetical protein EON63_22970 [archaeon]|nr:MAG: hypothetical protein EON63_22970 [archaeon]